MKIKLHHLSHVIQSGFDVMDKFNIAARFLDCLLAILRGKRKRCVKFLTFTELSFQITGTFTCAMSKLTGAYMRGRYSFSRSAQYYSK